MITPHTELVRSIYIYPVLDLGSFRIEGVNGEFDQICLSLGLYGPEDFEFRLLLGRLERLESADLSDNFGARVRSSDEVEQRDKYCELKNEFDSAKTETLLESFGARVRVSDEVKHGDRVRVRVRVRGNVIGEGTVPLNTFVNLIRVRHSRDGESGINVPFGPQTMVPAGQMGAGSSGIDVNQEPQLRNQKAEMA
ncbi:hypothetical protein LguiB_010893 [Lonicera macranthoides]